MCVQLRLLFNWVQERLARPVSQPAVSMAAACSLCKQLEHAAEGWVHVQDIMVASSSNSASPTAPEHTYARFHSDSIWSSVSDARGAASWDAPHASSSEEQPSSSLQQPRTSQSSQGESGTYCFL